MQRELYVQPVIDPDKPTHFPGRRQPEIRKTKCPATYQLHILLISPAGRIGHLELSAYARQFHLHPPLHRLRRSAKDRHLLEADKHDPQLRMLPVFQRALELTGHHSVITIEIPDIDSQRTQ